MTLEEIRELVALLKESGMGELEVQRGENRVRIRRSSPQEAHDVVIPSSSLYSVPGIIPTSTAPAASVTPTTIVPAYIPHEASRLQEPAHEDLVFVKSPIVGTFYEAPSTDAAPFVKIGDKVIPGKVLCIIESMKLMNEIEAEVSGTIVSKLVENGRPVEYGETLFGVKPN